MQAVKEKGDHTVVLSDECKEPFSSDHLTSWCKNCGARESLALPSGLEFSGEFLKLFAKMHKNCERRAEIPALDNKIYKGDWHKHLKW